MLHLAGTLSQSRWHATDSILPRLRLVHYLSSTTTATTPRHIAIVGSGPSACYTAKYIAQQAHCCRIDLIERLPTPYGLVRYGVAPDHPEVKNVQHDFDQLFENNTNNNHSSLSDTAAATTRPIRFFGNVTVGQDVSVETLRKRYDAVVLAYGCEADRKLPIEGSDTLQGVLSAREFVAWYNGAYV